MLTINDNYVLRQRTEGSYPVYSLTNRLGNTVDITQLDPSKVYKFQLSHPITLDTTHHHLPDITEIILVRIKRTPKGEGSERRTKSNYVFRPRGIKMSISKQKLVEHMKASNGHMTYQGADSRGLTFYLRKLLPK